MVTARSGRAMSWSMNCLDSWGMDFEPGRKSKKKASSAVMGDVEDILIEGCIVTNKVSKSHTRIHSAPIWPIT